VEVVEITHKGNDKGILALPNPFKNQKQGNGVSFGMKRFCGRKPGERGVRIGVRPPNTVQTIMDRRRIDGR
jgi:hypothetical protein